eukprot:782512_1
MLQRLLKYSNLLTLLIITANLVYPAFGSLSSDIESSSDDPYYVNFLDNYTTLNHDVTQLIAGYAQDGPTRFEIRIKDRMGSPISLVHLELILETFIHSCWFYVAMCEGTQYYKLKNALIMTRSVSRHEIQNFRLILMRFAVKSGMVVSINYNLRKKK